MKRSPFVLALAALPATVALACGPQEPSEMPVAPVTSAKAPEIPREHIALGEGPDEKAIDASVSPCQDFYQYACGGWNKATPIPEDQTSWMRSFSVIREENEKLLRTILEDLAKSPDEGSDSKALGDYYAACMDEAAIEKLDTAPLAPLLKEIAAVKTRQDLVKLLAHFHLAGLPELFQFSAQQDLKDATTVIGVFDQALGEKSLGLPEREYYLKDDARMKEIRTKYEEHVEKMLALSGFDKAAAKKGAASVLLVETELAKVSMTKEDLRDPDKLYHRLERDGLKDLAPELDWDGYLGAMGLPAVTTLNVSQPDFYKALAAMLSGLPEGAKPNGKGEEKGANGGKAPAKTPPKTETKTPAKTDTNDKAKAAPLPKFKLADVQSYLRYHVVDALAGKLPARFVDETFRFQKELTGAEKLPPRWKRCVRAVDRGMGEALGRTFVTRTIGEKGKESALALIHDIEDVMKGNLEKLSWMDAPTRSAAIGKLAGIGNKIAYPDKARDYSALRGKITRTGNLENLLAANTFESKRQLAKIGQPVDRTEWYMTPPTVNAYYDPQMNEMVFPAGILQPPFYANKSSIAVNFGGIGMVMGHELTHGFDDEGRKFDAKGNLTEWWTKPVSDEFTKRATCVEKQFDGYTAIGDLKVNGKLTLGENIADLGGIKLAHAALMKRVEGKIVDGPSKFTPSQQVFLGYAQAWCGNYRDRAMQVLVNTNPHSPPKFRVNGPLSNLPEFASAFSCKTGDAMVRKDRCEVW